MKKICSKCGLPKDISKFSKDKSKKDGLCSQCKACQKQYNQGHTAERAAYRRNRKAEIAAYYWDHKAERAAYGKRYKQTEAGKEANRKGSHKRRALMAEAEYEDFNPTEVMERDRYVCQLCGRKTRPDYNRYHPLFPNLDHIVPLSKGGAHTKGNTQCLCRECNATKQSNGKGDQLRLF